MALQIQERIVQTFAQPNLADIYGTYPTTEVADIAVTAAGVKCAGLTVGIKDATTGVVTEWWYQPVEGELQLVEKQSASINVDATPRQNSTNAVSSGGVYTALQEKANTSDIPSVPTISTNIESDANSDTKTTSPKAVKTYVDGKVSSAYKAAGTASSVSNLGSLDASHEGFVYNMSAAFTTTADFVEGAGKTYPAGTNVAIVNVGTAQSPSYKYDVMAGFVDLSNYVQKSQTVGLLKNDGTVDVQTADKAASALQPKQSGQYTQGNIVLFDANGGLTDSQKKTTDFATSEQGAKADTAVQQVTVNPNTVTGNAGTNASVTNEGTQTAPVLKFTIPRGQDAVNPFKGWWPDLATLKAAHTATAGDSAYVKDASPATTWSIYVYDSTASSDNNWADSGLDADTSHAQTFASGEEVNLTPIDETHLSNPSQNSLARALDVVGKLNMLGVTTTAKDLIISLFRKCAYTSQDAENIIANLEAEFEGNRVLMSITAELPTSYAFYDNQSLEDLRSILVVTANYDDGSTVGVTTYTLQGNITAGTSVITVSYGGMSTTVEVNVTHIIELTFSNSDFLKKCAADNRYDSVFNGVHYCLSSDVRCAYALFDKMLTGGKSYRLSISSSDSRTKVGVQAFTDSTLVKVANNEDFLVASPATSTIDAWDSGWIAFTDGVAIVTIPEKTTSDPLSAIRGVRLSIKIDNGSTYGLVIPTNYQISLTMTEIPD